MAKNNSTSFYGNIVCLDESPLHEGLLYAGTDDGLIQVTEDGGMNWKKREKFEGHAEMSATSRRSRLPCTTWIPSTPPSTTTRG